MLWLTSYCLLKLLPICKTQTGIWWLYICMDECCTNSTTSIVLEGVYRIMSPSKSHTTVTWKCIIVLSLSLGETPSPTDLRVYVFTIYLPSVVLKGSSTHSLGVKEVNKCPYQWHRRWEWIKTWQVSLLSASDTERATRTETWDCRGYLQDPAPRNNSICKLPQVITDASGHSVISALGNTLQGLFLKC